jgi:hypothetical protein
VEVVGIDFAVLVEEVAVEPIDSRHQSIGQVHDAVVVLDDMLGSQAQLAEPVAVGPRLVPGSQVSAVAVVVVSSCYWDFVEVPFSDSLADCLQGCSNDLTERKASQAAAMTGRAHRILLQHKRCHHADCPPTPPLDIVNTPEVVLWQDTSEKASLAAAHAVDLKEGSNFQAVVAFVQAVVACHTREHHEVPLGRSTGNSSCEVLVSQMNVSGQ